MKPLSKLSIEVLETHRLQWYGLAWLHTAALEQHSRGTTEAATLADQIGDALAEAAAIEAELERRRSRRTKAAPVTEAKTSATVIQGPWSSKS